MKLRRYIVTGPNYGSIVYAYHKAEARAIFLKHYPSEKTCTVITKLSAKHILEP